MQSISLPSNLDRAVMLLAGTLVLASTAAGLLWTPWAFALTAFVGINLVQTSFTGFCPAAILLSRFGVKGGCAFGTESPRD